MGSFTPLMFSTFGGMRNAATTVYKRTTSLLSAKKEALLLDEVLAAVLH